MDCDGDHDDHNDHTVEAFSVGHAGGEDEGAEQDRDGTLEPGEQDEVPFVGLQACEQQTEPHRDRPDHRGKHEPDKHAGHPRDGNHRWECNSLQLLAYFVATSRGSPTI